MGILEQRVYFVNNCETIEQVEEQERSFKRMYGENKVPDVLEMVVRQKKTDLIDNTEIKKQNITNHYLRSEIL